MSKFPALTARQVETALKHAGFIFVRQKGSHRIFVKDTLMVVVPFHSKDLRKGTLRNIVKQSGLSGEKFLKLL